MLDHKTLAEIADEAYNEYSFSTKNGTQVLFTMEQDHIVMAPRGTEKDYEDILTDMQGWPTYDYNLGLWGHYGFRKSSYQVWPALEDLILKKDYPVVLTGHSLGGAIATWLSLLMIWFGKRPEQLVAFGSPGCVSPKGAKILLENEVPVTLYRYGLDVIPTLPKFQRKVGLIKHVAPITRIGIKNNLFEDHRMAGYVKEAPADPPQNPFGLPSSSSPYDNMR